MHENELTKLRAGFSDGERDGRIEVWAVPARYTARKRCPSTLPIRRSCNLSSKPSKRPTNMRWGTPTTTQLRGRGVILTCPVGLLGMTTFRISAERQAGVAVHSLTMAELMSGDFAGSGVPTRREELSGENAQVRRYMGAMNTSPRATRCN